MNEWNKEEQLKRDKPKIQIIYKIKKKKKNCTCRSAKLKFSSSASSLDPLLEQHEIATWSELGLEHRSSVFSGVISRGTYDDGDENLNSSALSFLLLAEAELSRAARALVLTPTWATSITAISAIPLHFLTISLSKRLIHCFFLLVFFFLVWEREREREREIVLVLEKWWWWRWRRERWRVSWMVWMGFKLLRDCLFVGGGGPDLRDSVNSDRESLNGEFDGAVM